VSATVTIREANAEDARGIAEVHVAAWRWAYSAQLPPEYLDGLSVGQREDQWAQTLGGDDPYDAVVVAERDAVIVGFVSTGRAHDADAAAKTGELFAIYLSPEVVGTGVGRTLMERAVGELRRAGFVQASLWVLAANGRGRRFYERAGWRWDGTTGEFQIDCGNEPMVRYVREL
jgi:L-amino acid N-acyltransferase YncA